MAEPAPGGKLILFALILAVASIAIYVWAVNYTDNFSNAMAAGLGGLLGRRNHTYDIALMALQFSPLTFVAGLVLFFVGLVLKSR